MPAYPTSIDIDSVATHADLVQEVGSDDQLRGLGPRLPNDASDWSRPLREATLREVLRTLERRRPPIRSVDITNPTQLNIAVVYGTLARIFRNHMTSTQDRWSALSQRYEKMYQQELITMAIDIDDAVTVAQFGVSVDRG